LKYSGKNETSKEMLRVIIMLGIVASVYWCLVRASRPGIRIGDRQLWFLHVPKTAGTSIVKRFGPSTLAALLYAPKHAPASSFPRATQKACVGVVRNPYDRMVSFYTYARRGGNFYNRYGDWLVMRPFYRAAARRSFREFVRNLDTVLNECDNIWTFGSDALSFYQMHSLCYYLLDLDGSLHVTVAKFESLEADLSNILGSPVALSHANASNTRPWQEYYDEETAHLVYTRYRKDFFVFGYDPDSWKA
jgi:hypothetical protein